MSAATVFETPAAQHVGSPLSDDDLASLERRWITNDLAITAGRRRVDSAGAAFIGRRDNHTYSGLVIPYILPGEDHVREWRLRRDQPDIEYTKDGKPKERGKYLSPPGRGNMIYFPPGAPVDLLMARDMPMIITEGEFKTLALWRLAHHNLEGDKPRLLPVGLGGVWNWRGTVGKTTGPRGDRRDVKGPIPDLDRIAWEGRRVIIAFDADAEKNASVQAAKSQLARELRIRGAEAASIAWDVALGKGIDDLLAAVGPAKVLEIFETVDFDAAAEATTTSTSGVSRLPSPPNTSSPTISAASCTCTATAAIGRMAPPWSTGRSRSSWSACDSLLAGPAINPKRC